MPCGCISVSKSSVFFFNSLSNSSSSTIAVVFDSTSTYLVTTRVFVTCSSSSSSSSPSFQAAVGSFVKSSSTSLSLSSVSSSTSSSFSLACFVQNLFCATRASSFLPILSTSFTDKTRSGSDSSGSFLVSASLFSLSSSPTPRTPSLIAHFLISWIPNAAFLVSSTSCAHLADMDSDVASAPAGAGAPPAAIMPSVVAAFLGTAGPGEGAPETSLVGLGLARVPVTTFCSSSFLSIS
mmetsp:Transcript_1824/g.3175  ORF Transcript_1824/g.3175 Transcript_1824/m.3175 type:complete len:237 (+) Transcript_1824:1688-2398(+)